jgi:hypothetical protein
MARTPRRSPVGAAGSAALALARLDDSDLLAAENPDVVVTSLDDINLAQLAHGFVTDPHRPADES